MMIELIECGCSDEREKKSDKEIEELCKVFGHAVVHMFHFVMVFFDTGYSHMPTQQRTFLCQYKKKLNANNNSSSKKLLTLKMFV